jgi:DNA-binding transcriptional regulator YhcF (GntR family)
MSEVTTTLTREHHEDCRLLTAADVARQAACHPNTAKKIADELRLVIIRTQAGCRLFTPDQAAKITNEVERRRLESYR